jgi:hypothetical protein
MSRLRFVQEECLLEALQRDAVGSVWLGVLEQKVDSRIVPDSSVQLAAQALLHSLPRDVVARIPPVLITKHLSEQLGGEPIPLALPGDVFSRHQHQLSVRFKLVGVIVNGSWQVQDPLLVVEPLDHTVAKLNIINTTAVVDIQRVEQAVDILVIRIQVQRVEETGQYKHRARSITALGSHSPLG